MTSFLARYKPSKAYGAHSVVQVFAGPGSHNRSLCGELTMRDNEAREFIELVNQSEITRVKGLKAETD